MRLPTHAPHAFGPSTLDPFRVDLGRYVSYGSFATGGSQAIRIPRPRSPES